MNDFYRDYDVPQDLKFKTADILRMGGLECSAQLSPKYFERVFTAPNKITAGTPIPSAIPIGSFFKIYLARPPKSTPRPPPGSAHRRRGPAETFPKHPRKIAGIGKSAPRRNL